MSQKDQELNNLERTVTAILTRHGLLVEKVESNLIITKPKKQKASTYNYLIFVGIGIIMLGIILLFATGNLKLRYFAFLCTIIFAMASQFKKQKKAFDSLHKKISIGNELVQIVDNHDNDISYKNIDIECTESNIPRLGTSELGKKTYQEDLIYGRIILKTKHLGDVQLFELFGAERKYLEDDLNKIVQYLMMKIGL